MGTAGGFGASAPVALISLGALAENSAALVAATAGERVADLRHDAWGHGAELVARALLASGVDTFIVDAESRERIDAQPETHAARFAVEGTPTIDSAALYGLPDSGTTPVMRMAGSVLLVKPLLAGEGVSYGYLHRAEADTRIALVTGGYAQGVVRSLGGRISVGVAGHPRPVLGRVAMDACVVDIGDLPVSRGDRAVFFGDPAAGHPSLADWVTASGLRASEIVAMIGVRTRREVVA